MNLEKIKKILMSKKGIVASGVIVGTIVIGIIGGVLVNGASKSNDIAENNKPVINNKKEDNKKDKDESVVSKENNNAEDKKEEVKETESNINMPENSTSSNDININNTNKNNSQSSSSNANSNTSNNNSSNTSSNTNSNTSSNTNSNTSNGSTHTHSWNPITEQVHHDEVGHWEDVVVKPAWTESIPVYEDQAREICNGCGADITADPYSHMEQQMDAGNMKCSGFTTEWKQVQVGTNNVNHPAVTEKKWVVDKAAWTETVTVGHKCSCGATK
ncbi:hypothetical protein [Clostridium tertium]|uniref:hypothetical protein n=1 Tax=Clostridium tertium TaxID=1559 RepID=UPI0034A36603